MKKALVLILFPVALFSQERWGLGIQGTNGAVSATTSWAKIYVGSTAIRDVTVTNYDTDTDTVKVAFSKADTVGTREKNKWRILAGQSVTFLSMSNILGDTLWYKSTGTSVIDINAIVR